MKCAHCRRPAVVSLNDQDKPDEPMAYCLYCFWTWTKITSIGQRCIEPIEPFKVWTMAFIQK